MTCGCCAPSADISRYKSAEILAKQKFGNAYFLVENESKTFVLCYKMDEKKIQPHSSIHYFVYDLNTNQIVFEENLIDIEIKWFDDKNIEIRIIPEIISDDESQTIFC